MDLDELRNTWRKLDSRLDRLECDNARMARELIAGRVTTSRDRLSRTYRTTALVGLLLPCLAIFIIQVLKLSVWVALAYAAFGIIGAVCNFAFARYISSCNYMSRPLLECLSHALAVRRWRWRLFALSFTLGCAVVIWFMYELAGAQGYSAVVGGFVGLVVGLVIGFVKFRRQGRLIQSMVDELSEGCESETGC